MLNSFSPLGVLRAVRDAQRLEVWIKEVHPGNDNQATETVLPGTYINDHQAKTGPLTVYTNMLRADNCLLWEYDPRRFKEPQPRDDEEGGPLMQTQAPPPEFYIQVGERIVGLIAGKEPCRTTLERCC